MMIASGTRTITASNAYHSMCRDSLIGSDYARIGAAHKRSLSLPDLARLSRAVSIFSADLRNLSPEVPLLPLRKREKA